MDQVTLEGSRRRYAYEDPSILAVVADLASDLVTIGNVERVREIGKEAVAANQGDL